MPRRSAVARARRWSEETGESLDGLAVASDAFYPFDDALAMALDAGATAVVQPGGSRNDHRLHRRAERGVLARQLRRQLQCEPHDGSLPYTLSR